jgi:hypothetical protein
MPAPHRLLAAVIAGTGPAASSEVRAAIDAAKGDLRAAAKVLVIDRSTLFRLLKRLPGAKEGTSCRDWVDATWPQAHATKRWKKTEEPTS